MDPLSQLAPQRLRHVAVNQTMPILVYKFFHHRFPMPTHW